MLEWFNEHEVNYFNLPTYYFDSGNVILDMPEYDSGEDYNKTSFVALNCQACEEVISYTCAQFTCPVEVGRLHTNVD